MIRAPACAARSPTCISLAAASRRFAPAAARRRQTCCGVSFGPFHATQTSSRSPSAATMPASPTSSRAASSVRRRVRPAHRSRRAVRARRRFRRARAACTRRSASGHRGRPCSSPDTRGCCGQAVVRRLAGEDRRGRAAPAQRRQRSACPDDRGRGPAPPWVSLRRRAQRLRRPRSLLRRTAHPRCVRPRVLLLSPQRARLPHLCGRDQARLELRKLSAARHRTGVRAP